MSTKNTSACPTGRWTPNQIPLDLKVREAFGTEIPETPQDFNFTGKREQLTAFLIEKDAPESKCMEYVISDNGSAHGCTDPSDPRIQIRIWSVWRR